MKTPKWKPKVAYARMRARSASHELRPYVAADFEAWSAAYRARLPKQGRFDDGPVKVAELTRAAFQRMRARHRRLARLRAMFVFGLFDRATGAHLGAIDFFVLNAQLRWANLGYAIHNHAWGRGHASAGAGIALELAFGPLALHRVEAGCEPGHLASARVALNAGLVPEGRRRKFFAERGGVDLDVFGMNAIDWRKRRRK